MRTLGALTFLAALSMPILAQASELEIKLVVKCAPGLVHYPPVFSDKKTLCVDSQVIMNDADILFAQSTPVKGVGPAVTITFDKSAQARLSAITTDNVGGQVAILSEGKLITAATIEEPVLGDTMQIVLPPEAHDEILKLFQDRKLVK